MLCLSDGIECCIAISYFRQSKAEVNSGLINAFLAFLAAVVVVSREDSSTGINSAESYSSLLADSKVAS